MTIDYGTRFGILIKPTVESHSATADILRLSPPLAPVCQSSSISYHGAANRQGELFFPFTEDLEHSTNASTTSSDLPYTPQSATYSEEHGMIGSNKKSIQVTDRLPARQIQWKTSVEQLKANAVAQIF